MHAATDGYIGTEGGYGVGIRWNVAKACNLILHVRCMFVQKRALVSAFVHRAQPCAYRVY